ncbi:MAG: hypothetical protein KDA88_02815 [Planctomycetaceae bacterium]|nr:hypothetical protein [Planctomycetaceae bacterium]MCA9030982.1 hypothetical protein [Planctomycetaceae bacterium]MCB9950956.1 hypothetical protein [Planctomycetaceae bacterium]
MRTLAFPAYSIIIAETLSSQFNRFVTLNAYQLAGHVANLGFWSDEVAHCLNVLDQYRSRFERLAEAQRRHVAERGTIEFEHQDVWGETAKAPPRPRNLSDRDRLAARAALCDSFYRFLIRCHKSRLIEEQTLRQECVRHSISVDSHDLR